MTSTETREGEQTLSISGLNPRFRAVLKDVIHFYIVSGEPVSSRWVSRHGDQGLSAATIRNVMMDLEEMGLLRQPHTSAGRVPTEAAYRLYVANMMRAHHLDEEEQRYIGEALREASGDASRLMNVATHLLSELSKQVGVVLTPAVEDIFLKSADFVPLGGQRVLCVLTSMGGFVDHLVIELEEEMRREDLLRISNYMTENFVGVRMGDIRHKLLGMMGEERDRVDRWLERGMWLAGRAIDGSAAAEVLVEGTNVLLDRPELSDLEQVRRMLDTFADKARLVGVLNKCLSAKGVRVFLGEDTEVTSELDFSLVVTPYGLGDNALGTLGIIGPSRMEYSRMVPLVRFLGETLSKALAEASQH